MAQERIKKSRSSKKETADAAPVETKAEDSQALKDAIDDLLDEIDEVLEENASQFVSNYVQKGGQ